MTLKEAWEIIIDGERCKHGYEPCEFDEMKDVIEEFDEAYNLIAAHIRSLP